MDAEATRDFALRLMREVWIPFADDQVPRFYNRDVVGHHREQLLTYDDVIARLSSDHGRFSGSNYHIEDIIAAPDKFAIRFRFTATVNATGQPISTEVIYFYHLARSRIAEFWLLADFPFDYRAA
ncbi:ester cyclase [Methyloceanibacter sp.]|uniref:ester cyclase n=1 Tax=Methyloceanibacter sp. TaxID=1965321 RepID=UPI002D33933A|nr:ester cyclase [Methyloceanibacter sp.]HZP09364.1 ester cyclase [Methyloceanibacter sp.]